MNKKLILIACVMVVLPTAVIRSENEPYSAEATKGGAAKKPKQQSLSDKLKPLYNPQGLAFVSVSSAMLGLKKLGAIGLALTGIAYNEVIVESLKGASEQFAQEWKKITSKNL